MTTPLSGDELREFAGMSFMQAAAQVRSRSLLLLQLLGCPAGHSLSRNDLLPVPCNILQAGASAGTHALLRNA